MKSKTVLTNSTLYTSWTTIKWNCVYDTVKRLRIKIFQATKEGDIKSLRRYQQLMLRSKANLLLSIKKVTKVITSNNSIKEPNTTDAYRWNLYLNLKNLNEKHWVKLLKYNDLHRSIADIKFNPTGVSIITDRILQCIIKNALEPEWKFKFEKHSYGLQPNKHQVNVLGQLKNNISSCKTNSWVLQMDLSTYLNKLSDEILLSKLAQFPAKKIIYHWLKSKTCNFIGKSLTKPTSEFKNESISMLLTNIQLKGIENILDFAKTTSEGYYKEKNPVYTVRYINTIFIVSESKEQCIKVQEKFQSFLTEIGLKITHKSIQINPLIQGVTIFGYKLKTYNATNKQVKITPDPQSVFQIKEKLKRIWSKNKTQPPQIVILHLNRLIKNWASQYKIWNSSQAFRHLDFWMIHKMWRYALRRHPNKGKKWIKNKYFSSLENTELNWSFLPGKAIPRITHLMKFRRFKYKKQTLAKTDQLVTN